MLFNLTEVAGTVRVKAPETIADIPDTVAFSNTTISGNVPILTTTSPVQILDLYIGSDSKDLVINFTPRNKSGSYITSRTLLKANGSSFSSLPTIGDIYGTAHTYMNLNIYDEQNKQFFLQAKENFIFPWGVAISVRYSGVETVKAGAVLNYRILEGF